MSSDCLVYPHRGDGFGLAGLEVLASGMPAIITNWSRTVDYFDPSDTLLLDCTVRRSYEFDGIYKDFFEPGGEQRKLGAAIIGAFEDVDALVLRASGRGQSDGATGRGASYIILDVETEDGRDPLPY